MCSKSKYFLKVVLAEFRIRERLFKKTKKFDSNRIELTDGQDYLRLKKYPWISFSLTVTILDRLEERDLLFAISHFAAYAKCRE